MPRGWPICSMRLFTSALLGLAALLVTTGCQQQAETYQLNGATMGTTWSLSLHSLPATAEIEPLKQLLQARLEQINRLMSTYDPESEVSRFNAQRSTDWFAVSLESLKVVELSQQISSLTGGAFDISVGPLVELWGFGARERGQTVPTRAEVAKLLPAVGYQKLQVRQRPAAIRKQAALLQIDLSAVAKGYAVDQLAELLKRQGIENFLLEVGGELRISGNRFDGTPWRVAIEKPQPGQRQVEKIFRLTNIGLATSGNYRNFYVEDGQRYVHTIDPVSGTPIRHQLASATVLDPSCARADALATALMVMGEERGQRLCEAHDLACYLLIYQQERLVEYRSPAFLALLQEMEK